MLETCECGKEFLTEADPYLVIPVDNYKLNCGCKLTKEEEPLDVYSMSPEQYLELANKLQYNAQMGDLRKLTQTEVFKHLKNTHRVNKVADFYDDQVDAVVEGLTSLIEPMIIGVLGVVIGFIVIALFMPIMNMTSII